MRLEIHSMDIRYSFSICVYVRWIILSNLMFGTCLTFSRMSTFYGPHTHASTGTPEIHFQEQRNYMMKKIKHATHTQREGHECTETFVFVGIIYIYMIHFFTRSFFFALLSLSSSECVTLCGCAYPMYTVWACKLSQNDVPINGIVTKNICTFKHFHSHIHIDTFHVRLKWMVWRDDQPFGKLFLVSFFLAVLVCMNLSLIITINVTDATRRHQRAQYVISVDIDFYTHTHTQRSESPNSEGTKSAGGCELRTMFV